MPEKKPETLEFLRKIGHESAMAKINRMSHEDLLSRGLVSPPDVARMLKISLLRLFKLFENGLPTIKLGGRRVYFRAAIDAYFADETIPRRVGETNTMPKPRKPPTVEIQIESLTRKGLTDIAGAAAFLCVSKRAVYKLMQEKKLPFTRIEKRRTIPRVALERLIESKTEGFEGQMHAPGAL